MTKIKLDLHVHTSRSSDAFTDFPTLVRTVQEKRLDGVAITDHNIACSFQTKSIIVIPGIEVTSTRGHIIGLGSREIVPSGLTPDYTIETMRKQGYAIVIPHPFDSLSRNVDPTRLDKKVDAVETINASAFPFNRARRLAEKAAKSLDLPMVGGSDSHLPNTIGDAYTEVSVEDKKTESIIEAICSGKTIPRGHATSMKERLRKLTYFASLYSQSRTEGGP